MAIGSASRRLNRVSGVVGSIWFRLMLELSISEAFGTPATSVASRLSCEFVELLIACAFSYTNFPTILRKSVEPGGTLKNCDFLWLVNVKKEFFFIPCFSPLFGGFGTWRERVREGSVGWIIFPLSWMIFFVTTLKIEVDWRVWINNVSEEIKRWLKWDYILRKGERMSKNKDFFLQVQCDCERNVLVQWKKYTIFPHLSLIFSHGSPL